MDVYVLTYQGDGENAVEAVYLTAEAAMAGAAEAVGVPLSWRAFDGRRSLLSAEVAEGFGYRVEQAELVGDAHA